MNNLDDLRISVGVTGEDFVSMTSRQQPHGLRFKKWWVVAIWILILDQGMALSQTTRLPSITPSSSSINSGQLSLTETSTSDHGEVLAAGFGFQGAASSMITIRTYQAASGTVLSEDSYDLNVRDDGMPSGKGSRGKIFAGGIGLDRSGQSRFLLRVYDAETGKFLWEGQLNLRSQGDESMARPTATLVPTRPSTWHLSIKSPSATQTHLSLRAVDLKTGGIVWEDKFIPGSYAKGRAEGIAFHPPLVSTVEQSIGHVFDLVVLTFERLSGRLLWRDSFEELDQIDREVPERQSEVQPQTRPPWGSEVSGESSRHLVSTHDHYDF